MHKLIRVAVILGVIALLLATAAPALAAPPEKTTLVAPTIKGSEVKEPVAMVPDKSTGHPVFGANPAYGGIYGVDPGEPGKVFWSIEENGVPGEVGQVKKRVTVMGAALLSPILLGDYYSPLLLAHRL